MVGSKTTKTVTVERRGTFNDDAFFQDSWQEWDKAMKDVVQKWDHQDPSGTSATAAPVSGGETRSVYRKIRSSNVTSDDSQAVSCTEEDDRYKLVIDVKDFKPEDINVKTVDDQVVVEGKVEKKEGNSTSTQHFTRRFTLPSGVDMNAISSALSKDGVLTVNAPKLVASQGIGRRSVPITSSSARPGGSTPSRNLSDMPAAGLRTKKDITLDTKGAIKDCYPYQRPKSPVGSQSQSTLTQSSPSGPGRVQETVIMRVPDYRGSPSSQVSLQPVLNDHKKEHWETFNQMVTNSHKEMEDMMRRHSLQTDVEPSLMLSRSTSPPATGVSATVMVKNNLAPAGAVTTRDVVTSGNKVTERQEKRWDDTLAPGIVRNNRELSEKSEIKAADGTVIGTGARKEQESRAHGSKVETLPDGTKCQSFTKSYESRQVSNFSTGGAKAP